MADPAIVRFEFSEGEEGFRVRLDSPGFEPVSAPFRLDPSQGRVAKLEKYIETNRATGEHMSMYGAILWAALMTGEVGRRFDEIRRVPREDGAICHVRLCLPDALRSLPWETLYDERRKVFLAEDKDFCIVHELSPDLEPPPPPDGPREALRILVVVPEGAGLDAGREWQRLESIVERQGADRVRANRLDGRVTPDRLADELERGWDVMHFIGHGDTKEGKASLRLNRDDGADYWLSAERVGLLLRDHPVRLAVLNSCLGESPAGSTMASIAPFLLLAGVPAVVAMRYEIYEQDALNFTPAFYRYLLRSGGRVDLALGHARKRLRLNEHDASQRGFITPVFYLREGFERVVDIAPEDRPQPRPVARPRGGIELPPRLVRAFSEGRVVPVVGPGLLRAGLTRNGSDDVPPPGPRELAEILRAPFAYPLDSDFELSDAAPWLSHTLLSRVCQHCLSKDEGRFQALVLIESTYQDSTPPEAFRLLAGWDVPGMVYTFFDGLLARSLYEANRAYRVVNRVGDPGVTEDGQPLLAHLRGTVDDFQSLVLTERDHEELLDTMSPLGPAVAGLSTGKPGRVLLCVGVNHRDYVFRRFFRELRGDAGVQRIQDVPYFVSLSRNAVDEAYWSRFDVQWIDANPVDFLEAATVPASGGGA